MIRRTSNTPLLMISRILHIRKPTPLHASVLELDVRRGADGARIAILDERNARTRLEAARAEGFDDIAEWFETLAKAEKSHAGRFAKALESLDF